MEILFCYHFYYNFHKYFISIILLSFGLFSETTDALQSLTDLKNQLHLNNPLQLPGFNNNNNNNNGGSKLSNNNYNNKEPLTPCTCAVFLSGQFTRGSSEPPRGNPALVHEQEKTFPCTPTGLKQCQAKCLETIIKHLPNSADILCATIDRDCHKERAYLFMQNCEPKWHNSNLSAGREYCCKDGLPYQCPIVRR